MKVTIYSPNNSRADYIFYQYNSFRKHLKDPFEFIVINDAKEEPDFTNYMHEKTRQEIQTLCDELGITCLPFPADLHKNRRLLFPQSKYNQSPNSSFCCADVFQFAVNASADKEGIVMLIDSDMFLFQDVSFTEHLQGINMSYLPQGKTIRYAWNGIVWYKPTEIPPVKELNFDPGTIPGHPMDAGGMTHEYLQKYRDRLHVRYVTQEGSRPFAPPPPSHISLDMYPKCLQENPIVQTIVEAQPNYEMYGSWEVLDGFLVHYREGGNWNQRSLFEHAVKSRTLLSLFAGSFFERKNS